MSDLVAVRNLRRRGEKGPTALIDPLQVAEIYTGGVRTPDIMEFVLSDRYLNQAGIYPRQATLLKCIFLQDQLFTQYDYDVIGTWGESFARTGDHGCQPDLLERIRICKEQGRPWFREIIAVVGRRGSKGFLGALSGAYVLWHYMHKPGGPQSFYGIERSKKLVGIVFAGKKSQAKENQWRDLVSVISGGPCFSPYISRQLGEIMTIYAPSDILRAQEQALRGVTSDADQATFELVPRESSLMAARGPTSFMQFYDEMAHVVATGINRSAGEVYNCLDPETRVLGSDLVWRRIKELRPGDKVMGFDEHPQRPGEQRKLREATVQAAWKTRSAPMRITFEDGTSVVCSDNHRWFRVSENCNNGLWVYTRKPSRVGTNPKDNLGGNPTELKVGDRIRFIVEPWGDDDSHDAGYLAAAFDGEGHLHSPTASGAAFRATFTQNEGLMLDKVRRIVKEKGFTDTREFPSLHSQCRLLEIRGLASVLRLLGQIRPERLYAKQKSVWEGKSPKGKVKFKRIVSMERIPEQDLIDLQTSTATFIAEGLVSHNSATPSLDQFHNDGFIYAGSSPWQMTGRYYEMWQEAIAHEPDGSPSYPEKFMVQLESWDPYADYDRAEKIIVRPPQRFVVYIERDVSAFEKVKVPVEVEVPLETFVHKNNAIQSYDSNMQQLEKSNPDNFAVERRSKWAAIIDGYLDEKKVEAVFAPWQGDLLHVVPQGVLSVKYMAHGDPGLVNDLFGYAIGHVETVQQTRTTSDGETKVELVNHVVFDVLHAWDPADFPEHRIDYTVPEDEICRYIDAFMPDEQTFDQFNSASSISHIRKHVAEGNSPKKTQVYEVTANESANWVKAEIFKSAINNDRVHAPLLDVHGAPNDASIRAELEMRFLQRKGKRVDHPSSGPVQSKDVWDAMCEVVWRLIGKELAEEMGMELAALGIGTGMAGGANPYGSMTNHAAGKNDVTTLANQFSQASAGSAPGGMSPARGIGGRSR